jgi:TolB-like protein
MTTHRKLATILAADAVGYSRLMADDEAATLRSLNDARALFRERIEAHGGRLIDTAGDSILAEFPSAVEAVDCAVEIQHELSKRNSQLAEHRRMQFRIGINLGDVIAQEDATIYGDGVNVAARLQQLAEPAGICISGTAYDQVEGKLPLQFKFIGEQHVKNIPKPVRAYRVQFDARTSTTTSTLAMPTGPSVAVLPFTNMSSDPKEDYFSDGLTEDIITALSRFKQLFVIARNSTFKYKGRAVDVREISKDLRVQYVLEGSVRRFGERIRVTAQLIDADSGAHIWADTFDRKLEDVFAVQDEITHHIAGALGVQLERALLERARRKPTEAMEAYDLVLQATTYYRSHDPGEHAIGRDLLERAVSLDPRYSRAYRELSWNYLDEFRFGYNARPDPLDRALQAARKAVELAPDDAMAHWILAKIHFFRKELAQFTTQTEKALALNPNQAELIADVAVTILWLGRIDEAYDLTKKAMQLDPHPPGWYYFTVAFCQYMRRSDELALVALEQANMPGFYIYHAWRTMTLGRLGRIEEARKAAQETLRLKPGFSVEHHYRRYNVSEEILRQFLEGLPGTGLT